MPHNPVQNPQLLIATAINMLTLTASEPSMNLHNDRLLPFVSILPASGASYIAA